MRNLVDMRGKEVTIGAKVLWVTGYDGKETRWGRVVELTESLGQPVAVVKVAESCLSSWNKFTHVRLKTPYLVLVLDNDFMDAEFEWSS